MTRLSGLPFAFPGPLRTERLTLRHMTVDDIDDIHAYQSREDVCRYLPYEPRGREEVLAKLTEFEQARVIAADGDVWQLAVERAQAPGRVIGEVYFSLTSTANAAAAIGWILHPDHTGRGYMTEAAGAIMGLAFEAIGVHRVYAELDPRNIGSVALCRRLGMREEALHVEDVWFKGAWGDTGIYALLEREWAARTENSIIRPVPPGDAPTPAR